MLPAAWFYKHPTSQHVLCRAVRCSFRARGLPLPAHMISKGHEASWFSQREHSQLFEGCLDNDSYMPPFPLGQEAARRGVSVVGLVVKSRPEAMVKCLLKLGIPVVLDLIDSAVDDFSKYMVGGGVGGWALGTCAPCCAERGGRSSAL